MPYWTSDEAVALFLGMDPEVVNWELVQDYLEWPYATELSLNFSKLRELISRAIDVQEIGDPNSPIVYLKWAEDKGIKIPEKLTEQVEAIEKVKFKASAETENILKMKDEQIAALQKRITELETMIWDSFDENLSTHSKELAIAVKAHSAISKNWKKVLVLRNR